MTFVRATAFVILASLLMAAAPASASAIVLVSARAVHTSVHPHARAHRHHARHRHATNAELRAGSQRHNSHSRRGSPTVPRQRPAGRAHALPPHAYNKLQRGHERGGAPYALGLASLSLGLWTTGTSLSATENDRVTDPRLGHLKGRSPPRGNPPSAIASCSACAIAPMRAPAEPFRPSRSPKPGAEPRAKARRDPRPTAESNATPRPIATRIATTPRPIATRIATTPRRDALTATTLSRVLEPAATPSAPSSIAVATSINPDRAFEGRAAGQTLPSRRKFA